MGTWSLGGAFTFASWVKADDFRADARLINLDGTYKLAVHLGSPNNLSSLFGSTPGGDEIHDSGTGFWQWKAWTHIAVSLENAGTDSSTVRYYKNGSLFSSSTTATDRTMKKVTTAAVEVKQPKFMVSPATTLAQTFPSSERMLGISAAGMS